MKTANEVIEFLNNLLDNYRYMLTPKEIHEWKKIMSEYEDRE